MQFTEPLIRRAIEAKSSSGRELCFTLEANDNDELYIQLTSDQCNLAYPRGDEPVALLQSLGVTLSELALDSWEEETFVTFRHNGGNLGQVAAELTKIAQALYGMSGLESEWTASEEYL